MLGGPSGLRDGFAALRYPDFRRFSASLMLTSIAAQSVQIAVLWQVYELTGSALLLGLTGLVRAAPHIILSMVGGVIADRVDRTRLIQVGQFINGLLILALAALTFAGTIELWHLYAITSLNAAFSALTMPARSAIIPRLVPVNVIMNAIGLNATVQQTSQIIGPALTGVAIGAIGLGWVYGLTGGAYVVSMLVLLGMRTRFAPSESREGPWGAFVEGMRFVGSKPVILSLLLLDVWQTLFGGYRALLPVFADLVGAGPAGYGLLSAAPGVGSLVGSVFILSLGDMRYKGVYSIAGVLGYSLAMVLLGLSPWFWLTLFACGLSGAMNSVQMIPRNTAILTMSPDALRGRVEAFRSMLAGGAPTLGFTLAGAAAAAVGAPLAVLGGGIICAALTLGLAATRRELRQPDVGAPAEAAVEGTAAVVSSDVG